MRNVLHESPRSTEVRCTLARARTCYDHLAGEMAVRLLEKLREERFVVGGDKEMALADGGEAWCARVGIDLPALRAKRRRVCRPCLDWSERRTHLAGSLGAAILDRLFALGHARRDLASRVVSLSSRGERFVEHLELGG